MNQHIARGLRAAFVLGATALSVAGAQAAVPTEVSTAITGTGTDGSTVVGLMAAAGAAVFLLSKILKKFGVSL